MTVKNINQLILSDIADFVKKIGFVKNMIRA